MKTKGVERKALWKLNIEYSKEVIRWKESKQRFVYQKTCTKR
ncbi:hypothetical protein AVU44_gp51 [Clostridium phage phiCDHM19]|uniref:Uncharacterized protein n=2 Tax=root TaxID=1 RepID=A0A090EUH7_9CAUD|nr:hypothetical protein AVU44_gp51 [Clostridium phage phiCDHM19]CDS82858.1 hypothetical protein BN1097_1190004 [Clostridioides difficile]CDT68661.1 hypothetical protein BN1095_640029 [Clostridioides difficile]CDW17233.1 hypothetical protein [Clostridium phage phiCDHM19]